MVDILQILRFELVEKSERKRQSEKMNSGKQKVSTERGRRILRIHNWVWTIVFAVGAPALVIATTGYRGVWDVILSFGFGALFAWFFYWTNWINSVIFAVGLPAFVIAIRGYRSVWQVIFLFGGCGLLVYSRWFWMWVQKRTSEEFYEEFDKDKK